MGISHEAVPAMQGGTVTGSTSGQVFTSEDRADRTLYLLRGWDGSERKENCDQQRVSVGPREQILALYDEYRPRLFRYIRSMNMTRDEAEEVIQETFMRLTTELLQENDIENVPGWIVRVAHNLAIDTLKKNSRSSASATHENAIAFDNRADPSSSPEEAYLKKEQIRNMEKALTTVSSQHRQCFHLRVQGFRYKDIGHALAISEQRAAFIVKQVAVRLAALCG